MLSSNQGWLVTRTAMTLNSLPCSTPEIGEKRPLRPPVWVPSGQGLTLMRRTYCSQGRQVTCCAVSVSGLSCRDTSNTQLGSYSIAGLNSLGASLAGACQTPTNLVRHLIESDQQPRAAYQAFIQSWTIAEGSHARNEREHIIETDGLHAELASHSTQVKGHQAKSCTCSLLGFLSSSDF